ncbi:Tyrosine-protein phosphatase non-receptor type 23 [Geodia barretti]|uniref:Tyrosine-protein phosphatase non-receptor type 23 n=1 Tax=Geodia barretti TaxID=519541 RepID=A0AA35WGP3_GEOBA|nr:Tyrosine-protein phosphatase non-receptor type 23 [Geodia barretti]
MHACTDLMFCLVCGPRPLYTVPLQLKSNTELKAMFDQHYPNLVLLTSPLGSLKASLPKMTLLDTPAEEASESERWQQLLEEVDKMTQQRQVLVARFRQQMNSDDITKNLVGHLGNDHEVFLEDHLRQFKEVAAIIRQNLTAQENILTALTEANANKASTRQTVQEIAQQQQAMFASLVKSGGFLKLLQTKIQEGIVFYQKLQASVSRLRKRSAEVCEARRRERQNMERQRGSTVPEVTSPSAPPSVPAAPARPPKKAELAGRPLPPEQQGLPPLHGTIGINNISGGPGGDAAPLNALQPTPQPPDLQELQQVQMQQQQALLGGLRSPTSSESQQLGNSNPPNVVVPSETVPQSPPVPQVPVIPPTSVPDAAQALSSLQMLLQPDTQPLSPQQGLVVGAPTIATPAFLVPQRPPKPDHLKSGLLPSPFPSLPPPSEEQGTQPAVAKAHPSSFAGGTTLTEPGVDTGVPQTGGLYPETGSNVAGNSTLIPSDPLPGDNQVVTSSPGHLSLQSSTDSPLPPPTTSPVVWATATTGVGGSREDTPLYPPTSSTPAIPHSVSAEGTQHPVPLQDLGLSQTQSVLPMSPPYHHTNINILPGEVTVATSSILGPITSALAVEPATTSPASTLGMQAPPMQPAVGALPAPDARGQAQTAMSLPNLGDTFASGSGSLPSSGNQSGVPSTDPSSNQYTQSQDETVTGGSLQSDTPATNDDTSPARLWPGNVQRDLSEPQSTSSNASVSGSSPRVQFPQTGPSLQTMALPEIESQHQSTAAVDPPGAGPGSFSVLGSTDANLTTTLPNTTQMSSAGAATPPGSTSIQSDVTAGDPTSPATAHTICYQNSTVCFCNVPSGYAKAPKCDASTTDNS